MTPSRHIFLGILAGVAFALVDDVFINGHLASLVSLCLGAALLFVGLVRGQRLLLFSRALASVLVLYWAFSMCLLGRTMEPGLTTTTIGMALTYLFMLGIWPGLVLLRLWPLRTGTALLVALLPISFVLAAVVAAAEEYLFVQRYHDTGIGPTPRWTVPHHWLAYDRERHRLDGSD